MKDQAREVRFLCRGHRNIRGVHKKSLEFARAADISERATCVIGVRADYDADELSQLRGPVRVELRLDGIREEISATVSPFFQESGSVVLRKSDSRHGKTFAYAADKSAHQLDRRLLEALSDPSAELEVRIREMGTESRSSRGVLYVVSLPIGNDDDLSPRALRSLRSVDLIAAEDTRVARARLDPAGIRKELVSYHEHNEISRSDALVRRLLRGERVALISDAGTPGCSDPGYRLVVEALKSDIEVSAIPGPSALMTALAASGLPWDRFVFAAFLPRKRAARQSDLRQLGQLRMTVVLYESPRRIIELLNDINEILDDRPLCLGRELTKAHEEYLRGNAAELLEELEARDEVLGEFVVIIGPPEDEPEESSDLPEELSAFLRSLLAQELPLQALSRSLCEAYGKSRRFWYDLLLSLKKE